MALPDDGTRIYLTDSLEDICPEQWTPQFTTEPLELLRVLETTLALYQKQAHRRSAQRAQGGAHFRRPSVPVDAGASGGSQAHSRMELPP